MSNVSKINGEKEKIARELSEKNLNISQAGRILGVSKDTYKLWLVKNNLPLPAKVSKNQDKIDKLIIICKNAIKDGIKIHINETLEQLGLSKASGHDTINNNNLRAAVRSRSESALDKILSLEEAQQRLPNPNDKVIGFKDSHYIIQCEDGFIYNKLSSKLEQGDPRNKSGSVLTVTQVSDQLESLGYELVPGSYEIKRLPLEARHLKCGHIRKNRLDMFYTQECPVCSNTGVSKAELTVLEWVRSLGLEANKYDFKERSTKPKSIDIYIPSLKVGIEYNGLYWHSEDRMSNSAHFDKMKQAESEGIRLITIFEDEWLTREKQVKNFLKSVLNISEQVIYARKTDIKEVPKKIAQEFLEENHIQGSTTTEIAYGLYYEEILVGLISGNKHHRQDQQDKLVLNRLAFKDGYSVVGGSSKLLKPLIEYAKNKGYKQLISWSDNRWSQGKVYEKLDFTLEESLSPDYSYIYNRVRFPKQSCTKEKLLKKGAIGNTEREMAESLHYKRIYDCGKKRWSIKL